MRKIAYPPCDLIIDRRRTASEAPHDRLLQCNSPFSRYGESLRSHGADPQGGPRPEAGTGGRRAPVLAGILQFPDSREATANGSYWAAIPVAFYVPHRGDCYVYIRLLDVAGS